MSGLLHDVGKIGIDDNVLRKAGRLTDAEFEHIKKHPELGYKILADIKQLSDVLPAVLHHHEQWDGKGYPMGLSGEDIPQLARIMSVADAYDAMTSDRPYRAGMPDEKGRWHLQKWCRRPSGIQPSSMPTSRPRKISKTSAGANVLRLISTNKLGLSSREPAECRV